MNTMMKSTASLAMSFVYLTMTLVGPAAAGPLVPFSGSLQGQETDTLVGNPPEQLHVVGTVTGIATHLGKFTMTYDVMVSLATGSGVGSGRLIAANGDTITYDIAGQGTPVPDTPGLNSIVEINTITSGTGRFADAKGSFTVLRLVDLGTGDTSGSFQGVITTPGATH
jgi:hypothetical protein